MFWTLLTIIDIVLFAISAVAVVYILVFTIISCWYQHIETGITRKNGRFLIITTATAKDTGLEDTIKSFLKQQYDPKDFEMIVVGDNLTPLQKIKIAQYPITFLCSNFENGTKSQAQQYALQNMKSMKIFDNVILIDPDETVSPDFLSEVNKIFQSGRRFFQLHRKPLRINSDVTILSATMEEINNSIFRKGHVAVGMPSSLIGSAVSLEYTWFKNNVRLIDRKDEEKSLEALLLKQNKFVDYIDEVCVYYTPMSSSSDIANQRKRWMESKFSTFVTNLKQILPSLLHWNINLADKLFVWIMVPKIILMGIITLMSLIIPFIYFSMAIKWWGLLLIITFAFALATPDYLAQDQRWAKSFKHMPIILGKGLISLITNNILTRAVKNKLPHKKANS